MSDDRIKAAEGREARKRLAPHDGKRVEFRGVVSRWGRTKGSLGSAQEHLALQPAEIGGVEFEHTWLRHMDDWDVGPGEEIRGSIIVRKDFGRDFIDYTAEGKTILDLRVLRGGRWREAARVSDYEDDDLAPQPPVILTPPPPVHSAPPLVSNTFDLTSAIAVARQVREACGSWDAAARLVETLPALIELAGGREEMLKILGAVKELGC